MFFARFCLSLTVTLSLSSLVRCATYPTTGTRTSPPTTEVFTTPTTIPQGSCEWEGKWYPNGTEIEKDYYNCSKTTCMNGGVAFFDHECMFYTPPCSGESVRVKGVCCPVCINGTTTPTTTPPTTTPYGCYYNGKTYPEGEDITRDKYNCYGSICQDRQIIHWDHGCAFSTSPCNGVSKKIEGQCCPVCYTTTTSFQTTTPTSGNASTTTSTTTKTTEGAECYINGTKFFNGEDVTRDKYNCYGSVCDDGHIIKWAQSSCAYPTPPCNGVSKKIEGQCCPVCYTTTTSFQTTTRTSGNATATITTEGAECYINGIQFFNGQRTNTDPCVVCTCRDDREMCIAVMCQDVLDCDVSYRPYGTCCFICGSSKLETTFTWLLLVMTVLTRVFR